MFNSLGRSARKPPYRQSLIRALPNGFMGFGGDNRNLNAQWHFKPTVEGNAILNVDAAGGFSVFRGTSALGTRATPTALTSGITIFSFQVTGYGATSYSAAATGRLNFFAGEAWTDSAYGTYCTLDLTANGGTTRSEKIRFFGSGAVGVGTTTDPGAAGDINTVGILQTGGYSRVAADVAVTSNTTLANITGLTATVQAGLTYEFEAVLYTTANVAGGVQFAIAGTATHTSIIYEANVDQGGAALVIGTSRAAASGTKVGDVTAATAARCRITGTTTVNAAGTLTVQFAQNASNGAASTVLRGSTLKVRKIA